jgi:hypothetical protein
MIEKDEIKYPFQYLVLSMPDNFVNAIADLGLNQRYPTIDVEAMLANIFDIVQTDEAYGSSSRQEEIEYLLQEIPVVQESNNNHLQQMKSSIDTVITCVMTGLTQKGVFINGLQPFTFSKFIDPSTLLLDQSKVFNY